MPFEVLATSPAKPEQNRNCNLNLNVCLCVRLHAVAMIVVSLVGFTANAENWPRFRGPNGSGVSASAVPTEFGKDSNMKWSVALPGRGVSSPIVIGEKVFITCYSGYGMGDGEEGELEDLKRHLLCMNRQTGETLWTATEDAAMPEDPYSGMGVPSHGYASHTPTCDGERVYAFFGKSGVFAYDMDGKKLWHKDVGKESGRQRWGSSSSPILNDELLVVLASDESETMFGLDAKTGEERWSTPAAGFSDVWGTPAIADGKKGKEIVVAVPDETWAISPETGKLRWIAPGNGGGSHSVVVADDFVYSIGGSRGGSTAVAIRLGGQGEIDEPDWEQRSSNRFATPIVFEGRIYTVARDTVSCYDATNGDEIYQERLPAKLSGNSDAGGGRGGRRGRFGGQSYASPVIADGKLYVTDVGGTVYVIKTGDEFEVLAKNNLAFDKSGFNGTPAISDGDLFIRSNSHLYCIGG